MCLKQPVALPDSRDKVIRGNGIGACVFRVFAIGYPDVNPPLLRYIVPCRLVYRSIEADVLVIISSSSWQLQSRKIVPGIVSTWRRQLVGSPVSPLDRGIRESNSGSVRKRESTNDSRHRSSSPDTFFHSVMPYSRG